MKYIFFIIIVPILSVYIILESLNFFVAGFPSFKHPKIKIRINEIINYAYDKNKVYKYNDFLKVYSDDYKKFNYSGLIKKVGCGHIESGKYHLLYRTDKYGFRENEDIRHINSDVVLLGDSFTISLCINKPYDLKSNLINLNQNISYLNLGIHGTQPWQQLAIAKKILKKTKFNKIVWFFYEGNDYESPRDNFIDSYNKLVDPNTGLNSYILDTINMWTTIIDYEPTINDYLVKESNLPSDIKSTTIPFCSLTPKTF